MHWELRRNQQHTVRIGDEGEHWPMKRFGILLLLFTYAAGAQTIFTPMGLTSFKKKAASGGGTVTATDTFIRADANPISSPMSDGVSTWSTPVGASGIMQISSDNAVGAADVAMARASSPSFPANQATTNTISSSSASFGASSGPMVRLQSGGGGYLLEAQTSTTLQIFLVTDDGTLHFTALGSAFTIGGISAGDKMVLTVSGSTLTAIYNGTTLGSVTDSTFSSGQPGIFADGTTRFISGFGATSL